MIQMGGVWIPNDGEFFYRFHLTERDRDIPWFLANVSGRDRVIQAGGALGLYPLALADHFQSVVTFEPDPGNWKAMQANLRARDCHKRVKAWRGGLGQVRDTGGMAKPEPWNIGANRMVPGGAIPIYAIDDFAWAGPLDALWLDIEGMELFALKGAERTIREFSPVVICEENGNGSRYGVGPYDIEIYLETLGYEVECGVGNDRLYRKMP